MELLIAAYFLIGLVMIIAYIVSYPKTATYFGSWFWCMFWPLGIGFGLIGLFMKPGERLRRKLVKYATKNSPKSSRSK